MTTVTITTPAERRMIDNIEAGYQCPTCDSRDVQSITALTGRVDAGTMTERWGCNECGEVGVEQDFRVGEDENAIRVTALQTMLRTADGKKEQNDNHTRTIDRKKCLLGCAR